MPAAATTTRRNRIEPCARCTEPFASSCLPYCARCAPVEGLVSCSRRRSSRHQTLAQELEACWSIPTSSAAAGSACSSVSASASPRERARCTRAHERMHPRPAQTDTNLNALVGSVARRLWSAGRVAHPAEAPRDPPPVPQSARHAAREAGLNPNTSKRRRAPSPWFGRRWHEGGRGHDAIRMQREALDLAASLK